MTRVLLQSRLNTFSENVSSRVSIDGGGGPGRRLYAVDGPATCDSCDVVAGGSFSNRATFGGDDWVLRGAGVVIDAVLWRVSALGTTQWAVKGGGTSFDRVYSVASDGGGGVVAAGYYTNTATFGDVVRRCIQVDQHSVVTHAVETRMVSNS